MTKVYMKLERIDMKCSMKYIFEDKNVLENTDLLVSKMLNIYK